MKQSMDQGETERETEFGLMKEIVKKLVHALEDKATTDLISGNRDGTDNTGLNIASP